MCNVIGLSAYYHDSACCLLRDGVLVAAAEEERFTRHKHDASLPRHAFEWCLRSANLLIEDINCVAYYENPYRKLERQLCQLNGGLSSQRCLELWRRAVRPEKDIRDILGYDGEIELGEHHHSHAASAFLYSGCDEAALLTVDGVGEWATTTFGYGHDGIVEIFEETRFPHSLGLLYSAITHYLGFGVNDGEYKVMGLAAYGQPRYREAIQRLVCVVGQGQVALTADYFDFSRDDAMWSDALPGCIGQPPRAPGEPITASHADIASSLQSVIEELLLTQVRYLYRRTPCRNLCMAGGVALNCVANGRIRREGPFDNLFVQPAAGDSGAALGAAALAHTRLRGSTHPARRLEVATLGPSYSAQTVAAILEAGGIRAGDYRGRESELLHTSCNLIREGRVIGWFQGRMEFGPRALGSRSILADPRDRHSKERLNRVVKEREGFRPFAPAVLAEHAAEYFELDHPSPFMLETCSVKRPSELPSVTHVDGTARVQTVSAEAEPRFAALLAAFKEMTGYPILLNTSFNLRDEPIVASPEDALSCFARSRLDALVIQDFIVQRADLHEGLVRAAQNARALVRASQSQVYTFW